MQGRTEGTELFCGKDRRLAGPLPEENIDVFGYAPYFAQIGKNHEQAKPLTGFGSAGVLEVVEDWRGNTYGAVYTVRFAGGIFVLHRISEEEGEERLLRS